MELFEQIEKDLVKNWNRSIYRPLVAAIREYALINENDHIAVCISGGKDSMLLAKCMQLYARRSKMNITLRYICIDPGYTKANLEKIRENAALLNIPIEIFPVDIFASLEKRASSPCFQCAKMRRGYLYRIAESIGCNKIALGHHMDDVAETLLMSILYSGQIRGMRPILESDSLPGMYLIRPLYKVSENDIKSWRDTYSLKFLDCACVVTEKRVLREDGSSDSKRLEVKHLLSKLENETPGVIRNVFASTHHVADETIVGLSNESKSGK